MNESLHNKIEDFLDDKLTGEELVGFQQAYADDPALGEAVAAARLVRELSRQRPDFMRMIEAADKKTSVDQLTTEIKQDLGAAAGAKKGWKSKRVIIAALLLLAALVLYWYWPKKVTTADNIPPTLVDSSAQLPPTLPLDVKDTIVGEPDDTGPVLPRRTLPPIPLENPGVPAAPPPPPIAEANLGQKNRAVALELYEPYSPINLRGAAEIPSATDSISLAKAAYEGREWAKAIRLSPTGYIGTLKLKAHAAFQSGAYGLAADLFNKLEKDDPFDRETAQWYQLLSLAADGQSETPVFNNLLETISSSGHAYAADAQVFKE